MKIPLPAIMRSWRETGQRENLQSNRVVWALKLWHFAATRPRLYRALSWMLARLLWFAGGRSSRLRGLARLMGWGPNRDLPAPQGSTFHSQLATRKRTS
jgi:L-lactate dehydrogenase complex protein LldF